MQLRATCLTIFIMQSIPMSPDVLVERKVSNTVCCTHSNIHHHCQGSMHAQKPTKSRKTWQMHSLVLISSQSRLLPAQISKPRWSEVIVSTVVSHSLLSHKKHHHNHHHDQHHNQHDHDKIIITIKTITIIIIMNIIIIMIMIVSTVVSHSPFSQRWEI